MPSSVRAVPTGKPTDLPYNPVNRDFYRLDLLDTLKDYRRALVGEGITEYRD